jgi:dipeptidyl aminopeptidase/acylaminoacyl peptidase
MNTHPHLRKKLLSVLVLALAVSVILAGFALAQQPYKKPPKEILDVLNAPSTPQISVSPARDCFLLIESLRYPPIADLAQPMLRLAGLRINPSNNGPHRDQYYIALTLKKLTDGSEIKVALPPGARLSFPEWSLDGKRFAFTNTTARQIELWVGDTASGSVRKLSGIALNAAYGDPLRWMPNNKLLVQLIPAGRGEPPAAPSVPIGPNIQENYGKAGPVRTYQDLLNNPHDEDLFDYYATAQLALVDTDSGKATPIGQPAIFQTAEPSPDGKYLLIARVHRPYSYLHPHSFFPKEVEVWDVSGKLVHKLASLPLGDQIPIDGVATGPRNYHWCSIAPSTLVWVEALDGGDPKKRVPYRDRILILKAPFDDQPLELAKTEHRFAGLQWCEGNELVFLTEFDRDRRWNRTFLLNVNNPTEPPRLIWSLSAQDRYNNPGTLILRGQSASLSGRNSAVMQNGDWVFLSGAGATPEGDRPFLDRLNLKTLKSERLFRCDSNSYETVIALLSDDASKFITRRESPTDPPNYFIRTLAASNPVVANRYSLEALTKFTDPTPQLRGIKKQLVTYKRADGVQLSFTLYLPPNYKEGTRLPTVMWAYPLEFNDPIIAGQVSGSTQRFTTISGPSHLFFLLEGYAILDNAAMPVIGDPETVNNTYIEQIVANAKAAIDKAVEMGVTDPDRVGVGGHSYGAFMTANLLAHCDLFRAGIARSGAYNRTLTPFGFQNERRTLWQAPELYIKMSPFMYADKIKEPILLIHGEADNNPGTFPIQSERMYQAIRGNGGTVRYVTLPYESHGYVARESIEHTLYEMLTWFDKYVKMAEPRGKKEEKVSN